jgi:hypothetical protein
MSRKLLISIHLILAAFFAPILIIIGVSGGLYLFGEKGHVEKQEIYKGTSAEFDFSNKDKAGEIRRFIEANNIEHEFEYAKGGANFVITRPTSKQHLSFQLENNQLVVTQRTPSLIATIVELHKGHGPGLFKTFQKLTALGLFLIIISGLYLGITSPLLRNKTVAITGLGFLVTVAAVFI